MAFVPEGQADSSQARSAWYRRKAAPSRRDGRSHCQSQCQQNRFNRPARRGHFPRDSRHFVPGYYRAVPSGTKPIASGLALS
jgi:hypothetical protein